MPHDTEPDMESYQARPPSSDRVRLRRQDNVVKRIIQSLEKCLYSVASTWVKWKIASYIATGSRRQSRLHMSNPYRFNDNLQIQSVTVGDEQQKIIIVDDVLQNPHALVDFAINKHEFEHYKGHCNFYPGIRVPAPAEYSTALMQVIRPILLNEYADISAEWELNKAECSLSLITVKPENLRKVQATPHFDSANTYQFAILVYLCDESHGGTAFYRHNATQYETITHNNRKTFEDNYFKEIELTPIKKQYFTDSNERFTKIGLVDAKFNRMIIYRSCLLHSPHINPDQSVDADPRTGRLTVNSFFAF